MALSSEDLNKIESIVDRIVSNKIDGLATKAEMANLATKAEIANLATKSEIANLATKAEIANLATKVDLDRMESRLVTAINLLQRDTFARLDQHEARIERLEKVVAPR